MASQSQSRKRKRDIEAAGPPTFERASARDKKQQYITCARTCASDPHLHDLPSPHDSLHELLHGFLHAGWGRGLPAHEADCHSSKLCIHFLYQLQEGLAVLTQPCSLLFGKGHASMWQCHDEGISALSICAAEVK